ncbi:peroxiredoxin family protein [Ornithinimicrobium sufpigmenti]|uniref:peroxiredoxin family protein n=1 Tax=Ornithinimicrobium sufpigmenti TaxID=2508882 RepID=UPI001EDFF8CB|nr:MULTISPECIES: redoxin domain-containing protein [unclassified Ornithinimicrobium]
MSTRSARENRLARIAAEARSEERSRRVRRYGLVGTALVLVAMVVTAMLLTSRPASTELADAAPEFTLSDTAGGTVSLDQFRGSNVVLYFNEGAGCQSCLVQMAEIERNAALFEGLDITFLPVVMNTREQITHDMQLNGVRTPFLLDDGTVSQAYGTLGNGMHAGLPGHSFVLIDREGQRRWYGEYPSMWLSPEDLLAQVEKYLPA